MGQKQKLTESSKAVRLLRSKFRSGEVTGQELPKSVWESEPSFMDHKLNNFRTKFHKIRKELEGEGKAFSILSIIQLRTIEAAVLR